MNTEFRCYKCGCDSFKNTLVVVRAPGIWYICSECIEKEEIETGRVAVLSYSDGLFFTSQEEVNRLLNENNEQ